MDDKVHIARNSGALVFRLQLLAFGAFIASSVSMCLGLGFAILSGRSEDGWGNLMIFVALPGFVGAIAAIMVYQRLGSMTRDRLLRLLSILAGFAVLLAGVVFGGIPGAVVGRAVGGATGEFAGYLTTATIGGLVGGRYGWRVASRPVG